MDENNRVSANENKTEHQSLHIRNNLHRVDAEEQISNNTECEEGKIEKAWIETKKNEKEGILEEFADSKNEKPPPENNKDEPPPINKILDKRKYISKNKKSPP